ncbi:putative membrane protein EpsK [Anaerohalosphaera lusitana]|uniref:Putative membrane protein EpsK n=1 Tax=Anaerohalosphaera lusitana TaxID=1936003 RepID=A0A1U9NRK5_9BACT|nr:oligosaccharide flippase family protein [Anaerohalosphaera lusitana]AQT70338.1 putative membrane protein EpsK [Anaerohalosphaera lusitana]
MNQRNRLVINVITNYATFLLYGVANVFLVGYVVRQIGKEAFGLVSLVLSLTVFVDLFGRGICQALTKYVAAETGKENSRSITDYVTSSTVWFIFAGILGGSIVYVLSFFAGDWFEIPGDQLHTAKIALQLMALKVIVCFPFSSFQGVLWGYQRYDLTNLARSVAVLFRVLGTVICFEFFTAGVIPLVVVSILSFVVERVIWTLSSIKVAGGLHFNLNSFSLRALYVLAGFGSLMLIIQIANLLGYEVVKWVVGAELSVIDVGSYTIIATMVAFVGSLVRSIANVLVPATSRLDSLSQHDAKVRLAQTATKYSMIVAVGFCVVPVFFLKPLFLYWLGSEYSGRYLDSLVLAALVLLIGQLFISSALCVLQMLTGVGKVKIPAIVTLTWALGGIISVWSYLHWIYASLFAVVVGITIARVIGSMIHLTYGMYVLKIDKKLFISKSIVRPVIAGIFACGVGWLCSIYANFQDWKILVACVLFVATTYVFMTWLFVFNHRDRNLGTKLANKAFSKVSIRNAG